jgi:carboxylesterase
VKSPGADHEEALRQFLDAGVETSDSIGSDIKKPGVVEPSYDAVPLRGVLSLFEGMHDVGDNLAKIVAPGLVLSSREDHVVTSDNGDAVVESSSGTVERIWLEDSYHVATIDNDQELVETLTLDFLAKVLG